LARAEAQARSGHAGLRLLGAAVLIALPAAAEAWGPPTQGVVISTITLARQDGGPKVEQDNYADFDLPRSWSVTAKSHLSATAFDSASDLWLAAKWSRHGANQAYSVAFGPAWSDAGDADCAGVTGQVRAAYGRSLPWGNGGHFAETATEWRANQGRCAAAKLDFTYGVRSSPDYLWLGQGFFFTDRHAVDTIKVQVSGVKALNEGSGVQVGLRATVTDSRLGQPALVIGYWRAGFGR
jgi:hypothetical protein